jgi:FAD/FMN-containing dehydrogenase
MGNVLSSCFGKAANSSFEQSLLKSIPKNLVRFPGSVNYQLEFVKAYNKTFPTVPVAVTFPTTAEEVQAIVKVANQFNLKVQARGGGHSYGNYGNCPLSKLRG